MLRAGHREELRTQPLQLGRRRVIWRAHFCAADSYPGNNSGWMSRCRQSSHPSGMDGNADLEVLRDHATASPAPDKRPNANELRDGLGAMQWARPIGGHCQWSTFPARWL